MTIGFATWTQTIVARTKAPNATDATASPRLSRSGSGSAGRSSGVHGRSRGRHVRRPGPLRDREHEREPEQELDENGEGDAQAAHDGLADRFPRAEGHRAEREPGDRRDEREEEPHEPLPLRVQARPDEEAGRVGVLGGERARVAELHERGALGRVGRCAAGVGVGRVRDEGPDLRLQLVALAGRDGAQHRRDVAIGQRGHSSSPWASRRSEASTRVQSSNRAAACRSPSGLTR